MLRRAAVAQEGEFAPLLPRPTASATERGLIGPKPTAAVDATGLDRRHTSRYSARRSRAECATWAGLTAARDTRSHFLAGAAVTTGPSDDSPQLRPVTAQASLAVAWDRMPGDAAFGTEGNHAYPREQLRVRSAVIPINPRGHTGPPGGKYRAQMPARFRPRAEGARHKRVSCQRWQVKSAFSRHKRRLGSVLGGKSDASRERECRLRVLTHNLMLLAAAG